MRRLPAAATLALGLTATAAAVLHARAEARMVFKDRHVQPTFELQGTALGGVTAPEVHPAHLAGSTIVALDGGGALVIDGDSGALIRTDRTGAVIARVAIGPDAAQVVHDAAAGRAYVTDRRGDRVVVVEVGELLEVRARWETPAEPWGLALSPDRATLLVTTIADRALVALDAATGELRWQRPLAREPRGVAFAPTGDAALVAYLATGTVERIDLAGARRGVHVALVAGSAATGRRGSPRAIGGFVADDVPARAFARNAFAVRYVGHGLAVVGFQEATPVQLAGAHENTGGYGGGFEPPIDHRLAFVAADGGTDTRIVAARIVAHQPNAIGWDAASDRLVVAGYGSDDLLVLRDASQRSVALERHVSLAAGGPCGPDGVAVADGRAYVWCSLTRQVATVELATGVATRGAAASTSRRSARELAGLALFRAGNDARISSRGAMACSSCHPDGRADGLSWRIEQHELQTPVLAGRVAGTRPYKWDGGDADLTASLTGTMRRLGGTGLGADEVAALAAYLEALPAPRAPTRDARQVARGKALFADDGLGCAGCHGGKRRTDRERHALGGDLAEVDTPSLIGVAASAPYYHDGSAATLDALLRDTALVHGMAELDGLGEREIADLVAYLETL